jgi:hypothetical protein
VRGWPRFPHCLDFVWLKLWGNYDGKQAKAKRITDGLIFHFFAAD